VIRPAEPPTPQVVRGGDLSAQVLDQYRKDRGVSSGTAPKADLTVQVAGDARPERVLLFGRDIVVLGPGFKEGKGYTFLTLQQFSDASDVKDMSARDLTGDGAADLVVRGVRHQSTGKTSVDVEMMFVYEVKDDSIARVFAIETARDRKGKRVQGLVQFIPAPGGKSFDILSAPGRATGWSAKTYPWATALAVGRHRQRSLHVERVAVRPERLLGKRPAFLLNAWRRDRPRRPDRGFSAPALASWAGESQGSTLLPA
jgi:hypothetical protein